VIAVSQNETERFTVELLERVTDLMTKQQAMLCAAAESNTQQ